MKRKSLSRVARTRIFVDNGGMCCICQVPIYPASGEKFIIEHKDPLWLGGADDETNMAPAHERCAIEKTRREAPIKAKNDRQHANNIGIHRKSKGRPMPGTRASGIRKRMDGRIEKWS